MKKLLSEKALVILLFITAFSFFYIANEDAKKLGLQQDTKVSPAKILSADQTEQTPIEKSTATVELH